MKIIKSEIITENDVQYQVDTYSNGAVVKCRYTDPKDISEVPQAEPEEPITQDEINAEILLNQATIQAKQAEQDEALAQLLLNSVSN